MMLWKDLGTKRRSLLDEWRRKPAHEVLGVDPGSTPEEIRLAYLAKIKAYHPDRSDPFVRGYNQEMAKIVNQAYEQLMRERH